MIRLVVILALATSLSAEDVPLWAIRGIMKTESRSYYKPDGTVRYVDQRRGTSGEIGCMQVTRIAFNQVRRKGDDFWRMEKDTSYSVEIACRYLSYWHHRTGNWDSAVRKYNPRDPSYLSKVKKAAGVQ